jgi:asparagine synthase (glutamine-hydrolysing)
MTEEGCGATIAFNGEIYNFQELRAKLEGIGKKFRSRCDTEVALRWWCARGPGAVDDWRGMFAAAVWDPSSEELWLVRDHWGIKPLYYRADGESLAFCSEVRGLLATGVAAPRLSRRGIEDYLRYGAVQDPVTIIDGVYALLPGHALRWSRGKFETWPYTAPRLAAGSEAKALEPAAVREMFEEIVRQQLIADVPVVVFLSGGVDSSVVAAAARRASPDVHTMAVVFEESRYSEREYARRVARRLGTKHHEALLEGGAVLEKAVEAISRMDQPTVDGINTYVVSEAARREGFTVALSGLGGDEFFGGYATFRRTPMLARIARWAQRAPALASLAGRQLGWRKLGQWLQNGNYWEHPYFLQRTLFFPRQVEALCRAGELSAEADRLGEARRQTVMEEAQGLDPLNQVSLLEARCYMANMLLRDSDQMSMAHSLELRVPFVDHLLAARLLATPGAQKGFRRAGKPWLKAAFGAQLPREVFERRKMGFTLPFAVWLKGPLAAEVERVLRRNPGGLWDPGAAGQVWEQFWQGRLGWSRPWALYVLSRWVAEHIYGETRNISRVESTR